MTPVGALRATGSVPAESRAANARSVLGQRLAFSRGETLQRRPCLAPAGRCDREACNVAFNFADARTHSAGCMAQVCSVHSTFPVVCDSPCHSHTQPAPGAEGDVPFSPALTFPLYQELPACFFLSSMGPSLCILQLQLSGLLRNLLFTWQ